LQAEEQGIEAILSVIVKKLSHSQTVCTKSVILGEKKKKKKKCFFMFTPKGRQPNKKSEKEVGVLTEERTFSRGESEVIADEREKTSERLNTTTCPRVGEEKPMTSLTSRTMEEKAGYEERS